MIHRENIQVNSEILCYGDCKKNINSREEKNIANYGILTKM